MRGDIYIDRNGDEWAIQRRVSKRNGQIRFLYRLSKVNSVFETKWFDNDGLWAFILKAKWARKREGGIPVYDDVNGRYDIGEEE